jgi:ribonuclease-3
MAESAGRGAALDWKTSLQELTAALGLGVPDYVIEDSGPDHAKTFTAWVVVAGERYGGSEGRSKKQAEQRAAAAAWRTLNERGNESDGATPAAPEEPTEKPAEDDLPQDEDVSR